MAGVASQMQPAGPGSRCSTLQAMLAVRGWELGADGVTVPPTGEVHPPASCGMWWARTALPERRRSPRNLPDQPVAADI